MTKVDNLEQLRQRKAALKTRMDVERTELMATYQALRAEMEPAKLVTNVARSLLGIKEKATDKTSGITDFATRFSGPMKVVADLLVREPRIRLLVKYIAPLIITYLPQVARKARDITPEKAEIYGFLRQGVTGLRKKFHKKRTAAEETAVEEEPVEYPD